MILEDASDLDCFVEIELQACRDEDEDDEASRLHSPAARRRQQQQQREGRWLSKVRLALRSLLASLGSLWRRLAPSAAAAASRRCRLCPRCSALAEHAQVDVMAWSSHLERAGSQGVVRMDLFASPSSDLVRKLEGYLYTQRSLL